MTDLKKPVRRAVPDMAVCRGRKLVVSLYPNQTIGLRIARTRREHVVPLARVFRLACEMTAEADRKAREQRRAADRAAKGLPPLQLQRLVRRGLLYGQAWS
jgi:hypothetical protein